MARWVSCVQTEPAPAAAQLAAPQAVPTCMRSQDSRVGSSMGVPPGRRVLILPAVATLVQWLKRLCAAARCAYSQPSPQNTPVLSARGLPDLVVIDASSRGILAFSASAPPGSLQVDGSASQAAGGGGGGGGAGLGTRSGALTTAHLASRACREAGRAVLGASNHRHPASSSASASTPPAFPARLEARYGCW